MTLLFLEALGAGLLFIGIIWWTMFSGRKNGELPTADPVQAKPQAEPAATGAPTASAEGHDREAQKAP